MAETLIKSPQSENSACCSQCFSPKILRVKCIYCNTTYCIQCVNLYLSEFKNIFRMEHCPSCKLSWNPNIINNKLQKAVAKDKLLKYTFHIQHKMLLEKIQKKLSPDNDI